MNQNKAPAAPGFKDQKVRYQACVCGMERCKELRKYFNDKFGPDPLGRQLTRFLRFESGLKAKANGKKAPTQAEPSGKRIAKTDKRKSIYEEFCGRKLQYGKNYWIAALHFPIEVLSYCSLKNKEPTKPFKQIEMGDMIAAGLAKYLPPITAAYECKDYYGQSVFYLPPTISVEVVDYQVQVQQAMERFRSRNVALPPPQPVARMPTRFPGKEAVEDEATGAEFNQVPVAAVQEVAAADRQASPATISVGATTVASKPSPVAPAGIEEPDLSSNEIAAALEYFLTDGREDALKPNLFHLTEASELDPTTNFPRLGSFEEILHHWVAKEEENGDPSTQKTKEEYAKNAMRQVERMSILLRDNPPPESDTLTSIPESIMGHLTQAARKAIQESIEKTKAGHSGIHQGLIVPIANHIGNGYVDLYYRLNPHTDDLEVGANCNRKRRRDPDSGYDQPRPGRKDDSDPPVGGDHGANGGQVQGPNGTVQGQEMGTTRAGRLPKEICCVVQSLRESGFQKTSFASDDSTIETEAGSWASCYDRFSNSDGGLLLLAKAIESHTGHNYTRSYRHVLDVPAATRECGLPEVAIARPNIERGEAGAPVFVLNDLNQPKAEFVRLVKAENPQYAYRNTGKAPEIVNVQGLQSEIFQALLLHRVNRESVPLFQMPAEEAYQYVSIKRVKKSSLQGYSGPECPFREISFLNEFADDVCVQKLVEALQDDEYIYIVTPDNLKGCLLRDMLCRSAPYSQEEIKVVFRSIVEILVFLRTHNLYHCALTPEYFEFNGDRLILTRLGLAHRILDEENRFGVFQVPLGPANAVSFQPPEVYSEGMIMDCTSANLWGASLTLYLLLSGRAPFSVPDLDDPGFRLFLSTGELQSMVAFLRARVEIPEHKQYYDNPRTFASARDQIPPVAMEILSRMLKVRPSERMKVQEVVRDVQSWTESQ